jgi:AcrR family transcriptional regulator
MEEIAQVAGKGKSTLYYYFPSKREIFEAAVEDEMKNLVKKLRIAINKATTAKDKLKAFGNTHIASIIEYQNLDKVLRMTCLIILRLY